MHRAGLQAQTKAKLLIQLTGPSRHVNGCPFCDDLDPIQQTISVSSKSSSTHPFFQVQSTNPSKVPSRPLTAISTARRSRSSHRFSMHMKLRTCGFHYIARASIRTAVARSHGCKTHICIPAYRYVSCAMDVYQHTSAMCDEPRLILSEPAVIMFLLRQSNGAAFIYLAYAYGHAQIQRGRTRGTSYIKDACTYASNTHAFCTRAFILETI